MLPFLAFPRYFINNPITRREYRFLRGDREKLGWRRVALACLIFLVGTFAVYPFWHYIVYESVMELSFLTGIIYVFHLGATIWAFERSSKTISREFSTGQWEDLILTGTDARQIVISKWYAATIYIIPIFLIAGLLKLGPACNLAQRLHMTQSSNYGSALTYTSWLNAWYLELNPSLLKTATGGVVLLTYSVAESCLISALGIGSAFLMHRRTWLSAFPAILLRGGLVIAVMLIWFGINQQTFDWFELSYELQNQSTTNSSAWTDHIQTIRDWAYLLESVQLAASPLADNGMIITAYLMRPTGSHFHILQALFYAGIGLLLFFILIWLVLRIVQILAVRRGALPPHRLDQVLK